jgi:hypothetical protein
LEKQQLDDQSQKVKSRGLRFSRAIDAFERLGGTKNFLRVEKFQKRVLA